MAKVTERLTVALVEKLKNVIGMHPDGNGLYLQARQIGHASWIQRYKIRGRERHMGLGPLSLFGLAEARAKSLEARRQIYNGIDPLDARDAERSKTTRDAASSITFAEAAEKYRQAKQSEWSYGHRVQTERHLEMYALPVLGKLMIATIETPQIRQVLDPIWLAKSVTARRLRSTLEAIFNWAKANQYREGDNPARWVGHLQYLMAKNRKKAVHHGAVEWRQLGGFMAKLREKSAASATALEFVILTCARVNEALEATAEEFDLTRKIWTIPAERMKAKAPHCVPLAPRTIEILEQLGIRDRKPSERVFSSTQSALLLLLKSTMGYQSATVHGFRSCFADWARNRTRFDGDHVEMCLAHSVKSETQAAYWRDDVIEKRRQIMEAWAAYCAKPTPVVDAKVTPLRAAS